MSISTMTVQLFVQQLLHPAALIGHIAEGLIGPEHLPGRLAFTASVDAVIVEMDIKFPGFL